MVWPGAAIICYHAVTSADFPSASPANISYEEITRSIEHLRNDREIIPLLELLRRRQHGRSIAGLAAITFDDAYASVGEKLVPWLRNRSLPCTMFVTNMASESGERFWWDRVDDSFPRVLPERWRVFEDQIGLPQEYRDGQPKEFGQLRPLRQYMLAEYKGRWPSHLQSALSALEQWAGLQTTQRPMTYEELDSICSLDGVDIGVHTESHPVLPLLTDEELSREIRYSFDKLQDRFQQVVPVLAVPFGLFDARTLKLATEVGMMSSLTLENRIADANQSSAACPRFSMTRGAPLWKQRLRWSGAVQATRDLMRGGRVVNYPALPSATT